MMKRNTIADIITVVTIIALVICVLCFPKMNKYYFFSKV